jgi:3-isopropylmalate/(R)-2-methylmalate dehydratase small subunit
VRVFRVESGIVAPLDRDNVDTDQIIPKQFLKRIERSGFGDFLFHDWRADRDFILNAPRYREATILVTGSNFGCGSSREHAPWALLDHGFRALLAPSFADIFATNCAKNGLLTVSLERALIDEILRRANETEGYRLTVDLERCRIHDAEGLDATFTIDAFRRRCLVEGLDEIALTLLHEPEITAYERRVGGKSEG